MPYDSIPHRLLQQAATHPDRPALYTRGPEKWEPLTWSEYADRVRKAAKSLVALGMEPGGTVCILGFNREEWVVLDVACMMAGGAPAGIYQTCSPPEVQYIVDHAESAIVLVEDEEQWQKIAAERENLPKLRHVITMRGAPAIDDDLVMTWDAFLEKGADVPDSAVDERLEGIRPDQIGTFIYTSGTTGPPKAVMLSHENLAWTSKQAVSLVEFREDDCSVSYLPLSHIAEQVFTIHAPITSGASVYFAQGIDKVADNLKEVQPTVVFGVPRIWEKFHAAVSGKLAEATGFKATLLGWARGVGRRAVDVKNQGGTPSGLLGMQYGLADKLIFSKLKPALGLGRARVCVTGAAPVAKEVLEFFASLDLIIHEVYGQSEGCGPTTFNAPGRTRFGTVGPAFPGVEVKIAEDGEILAKGPNIFLGYYKDEEATNETLIDGWLHSGDLGAFDEDGFLTITGRKKEIIITAGGKNIAPKNIESALRGLDLVSQAVVIGDRRKFLSALLTLDPDKRKAWAEAHGADPATVHEDPQLLAEIGKGVEQVNSLFARVEHIRKFRVLPEDFSVDGGELTPTMKIKRNVVNDKYGDTIESMYAEGEKQTA